VCHRLKFPAPTYLTSQQEVEQYLSEALALQFQLTAHSPFLTDPLHYELGLLGASPAAQAILQGTYECPAGVNLYTQQLVSILRIPQQFYPIASGISQDDFINHWKCCKSRPLPHILAYTTGTTRPELIALESLSSMPYSPK